MKKTLLSLAALATITLAGTAHAQYTVQLGYIHVDPRSDATSISGPFTPVDALSLKVKEQGTLYFSVLRALDDHWSLQAAMGVPPTHDVAIVVLNPAAVTPGVAAQDGVTGSKIRQVAPTFFVNYNFGDKTSAWRPFVGLGLNYTTFDRRESTPTLDAVNGGPTNIKLKDSFGLAAQLGLTYQIDPKWSITGSWATAKVSTDLTLNTLGIVRTAKIDFHPSALALSVGYSF